MNAVTPEDLIKSLKTIPPFHLTILDLVWICVDVEGDIDPEIASLHALEIDTAIDDARTYASGCFALALQVRKCPS